jgi:ABC-type transporter Mla subunit MlaD
VQLNQLQNQIQDYNRTYKSDFVENIQQPIGCLNSNMTDIGPTIDDAQKSINEFTDSHKNTIAGLGSQNKDIIKSLCDFSKNDAQINEQIDNSLNKLLQQLQNNLDQKQQQSQKNSDENEDSQESSENNSQESSDGIQYKNVFEEDELKLLQQIDTNNKSLIQQIQNIK